MKSVKIFLVVLSVLNFYLVICFLIREDYLKRFFLNNIFIDYLWILLSPIVSFVFFMIIIHELIYSKKFFKELRRNYKIIFFLNIAISITLTFLSLRFLNAVTDGGLFP